MLLFLDYDQTLTEHDTLSLIPGPSPNSSSCDFQASNDSLPLKFDHYTQAYLSDLNSHNLHWVVPSSSSPSIKPSPSSSSPLKTHYIYLSSLQAIERKSVQRVERGGLFLRWDPTRAKERARREVRFRVGVGVGVGVGGGGSTSTSTSGPTSPSNSTSTPPTLSTFLQTNRSSLHAGILSVSWSRLFLRASLDAQGVPALDFLHANEVLLDPHTGRGRGRGVLSKGGGRGREGTEGEEGGEEEEKEEEGTGIRTGLDKLKWMRYEICKEERSTVNINANERVNGEALPLPLPLTKRTRHRYSVYAGDSNTDLPCLLESSLGLILSDASSLLDTLARLGFAHRIVHGYRGFVAWLERGGTLRGIDWERARRGEWSEQEEDVKAEDVCLVRVKDWVEGTRVLDRLLKMEKEKQGL